MDLSIVIPAYNESRKITETLHATTSFLDGQSWQCEIIVVDDGSVDGTALTVEETAKTDERITCLCNGQNRGKGYSVREGVRRAQGGVIGYVDADNKTEISGLDRVMQMLSEEDVEGVLGDRTLTESDIVCARRNYRQWGSDLFRYLLRSYAGVREFPDTQCGFKFFKREVAKRLFEQQRVDGYMFDVEILMLAMRLGFRVERMPVVWRDDPDSRFNPVTGMLRNLEELRRIRRSMRGGSP